MQKKKDKICIWSSILETIIFIALLSACFEALKQYLINDLTDMQWHILTVLFSAVSACIVLYFILKKHIIHNQSLLLEITHLKKLEEELRTEVNDLQHFKELVMWWGKKINEVQDDLDAIKKRLDMHHTGTEKKD